MSRYIMPQAPNPEILARVSERDVMHWMAARLQQIRTEDSVPVHHISLNIWHRKWKGQEYDADFDIHASSALEMNHESLVPAVAALRLKLNDNPEAKAAEKRRSAQALLEEAAELEQLASKLKQPA